MTAPAIEPMPPKMTKTRMRIEVCTMKSLWIWLAKNTPANPDVEAPMAKAMTLYLRALMPTESAATSSSRIAVHERPTRECSRKLNATMKTTATPKIK